MTPHAPSGCSLGFETQIQQTYCPQFWGWNWQTQLKYPQRFLHNFDTYHHLSSTSRSSSPYAPTWLGQSLSWLGQHNLCHLHMYTCLLMSPSVIRPWSVLWPLIRRPKASMFILHHCKSIGTTFFIVVSRLNTQHLHITRQKTCCTHYYLCHGLSQTLNQSSIISWQLLITHHIWAHIHYAYVRSMQSNHRKIMWHISV